MIVNLTITPRRISDLIVTAFEDGALYWLRNVELISSEFRNPDENPWYADPFVFEGKFRIKIAFESPIDGEDISITVDKNVLLQGMTRFAQRCPRQFGEFLADNEDANTADCFLQCLVLGDVIYG